MSLSADGRAPGKLRALLREEWFLGISAASCLLLLLVGKGVLERLSGLGWFTVIFAWLFIAVLGSVFCVVRHADHLALRLGEPYGTLVLTLAVTAIEVISISAVMFHGENNPTLVRDTLFAVVMIVLNGMVGLSLLIGGWRHREQYYNLQGANAYLGVIIPLAVLSLILPSFTVSTSGPTFSMAQECFLAVVSVGLYGTFLVIQTRHHRGYFTLGEETDTRERRHAAGAVGHETRRQDAGAPGAESAGGPLAKHAVMLVVSMLLVVFLAEHLAVPLDYLIEVAHAPAPLGGVIVAVLVATPEAISAVQAARANRLQRSVNIFLGSVLATIGLTIPTMLVISHLTDKQLVLGVQHSDLVLLPLTLVVSVVTFASGRTNILQGAVHLLLFAAYIVLIFQG